MANGRGIASFLAGFGTGYMNQQEKNRENKRQDDMDKRQAELDARQKTEWDDKQEEKRKDNEMRDQLRQASAPTYTDQKNIAADGLTAALPKVFTDGAAAPVSANQQYVTDPNATPSLSAAPVDSATQVPNGQPPVSGSLPVATTPTDGSTPPAATSGYAAQSPDTLTGEQKAAEFLKNSTPEQQAQFANYYAKQGLSATGNEVFTQGKDDSGLAVADKSTAVQKPLWQVMEDRAKVYLASDNPKYEDQAYSMLEKSTAQKSKDYQQSILTARSQGLDALLKLANDHPNEELPYHDMKIEPSADGKSAKLTGTMADTGKPFEHVYDTTNKSVEDQITEDLMARASPDALLKHIQQQVADKIASREEDRKNKLTTASLDESAQKIQKGSKELAVFDANNSLDQAAKRASINSSNASAANSSASAAKTREETSDLKNGTGVKQPESIREAIAYGTLTPDQKSTYDRLNDKSAKVTPDPVNGGYLIQSKTGMYKMDDKGVAVKIKLPDGTEPPIVANRPPLSSFNK